MPSHPDPALRIEPLHARPRPADQLAALFAGGWPAFIAADRAAEKLLPQIRSQFADLEIALLDGEELVGAAWAVPIRWDGTVGNLPAGYTDSLARALARPRAEADTLVICAAQVHPAHSGRGLGAPLIVGLTELAERSGYRKVVAPLRPTAKHRYPLAPIERYAAWLRADGSAFDPWLRTHLRLGARLLCPAPASQEMTGTVEQWTGWTGLPFPETGDYVIPDGLATLRIDRDADLGRYVEPGVWVQHR